MGRRDGLYYYGARYLEPKLSRWMSADPAGFGLVNPMEQDNEGKLKAKQDYSIVESLNWYSYVSNNPLKWIDPSGLFQVSDETKNMYPKSVISLAD